MCIELYKGDFNKVKKFFCEKKYHIPALAVLNHNFPGRVFVDNIENPTIALVWIISRWSYVNYYCSGEKVKKFLKKLFKNRIEPSLTAMGDGYFELYGLEADNNNDIILESFPDYNIKKHYENTFIFNKFMYDKLEIPKNEAFIASMKERSISIIPEKYKPYVEEEFKNKITYGIALEKNNNVIAQCSNNGFLSQEEYFIDLDTFFMEERRKGYGTLVAYELIKKQLEKGLIPLWETTLDNIPSQRIAEKLGFEKKEQYAVYSIELEKKA